MWNNPDQPYQLLPEVPAAKILETPAVLKANISAARALARLDGTCCRLPDPTMLINLIPLMEAQASSEIENIVTTNDELFRAANGAMHNTTPQVKEALRYREALRVGYESLKNKPITTNTAIDICSHILGKPAIIRDSPGTYIGNPATSTKIYTPPVGVETILRHLANWEKLLHLRQDLDPLVIMAAAHYQFEAIHPFFDGNGRTGRIINMLYLIDAQLLKLPILYLSGYIVRTKSEYYRRLGNVTTRGDWESWLVYMLNGVEITANWTTALVEQIDQIHKRFEQCIRELMPKVPVSDLSKLIFTQPYVRIDNIVEAGLAQRQTASRWLNVLVDAKLLMQERAGRTMVFVNHQLLDALFNTPLPE